MFNLDHAIADWRRKMTAAGIKSRDVLDELESHLRDDVEQQMRSGIGAERSFQEAVQRVGTAKNLNQEFAKVRRPGGRFSRRMLRSWCLAAAAFVFVVETWTLMISETTTAERILGMVIVSVIACYVGAVVDLNRLLGPGVRGWKFRHAIATVCNYGVVAWVCLLLLSLVLPIPLPSEIVFGILWWSLAGAAAMTVLILACDTDPEMLDLWSPGAWKSFELAENEAVHFHHDFIGTEHVLLGLLGEENGSVSAVLRKMGVRCETIRTEIEKIVGVGPQLQNDREPVCTPRAKKALQIAVQEAEAAGRNRVEPEHIFLGLLREGGGVAAKVLNGLGVNTATARAEMIKQPDSR
jgi:ClpA/ClpB-like protein